MKKQRIKNWATRGLAVLATTAALTYGCHRVAAVESAYEETPSRAVHTGVLETSGGTLTGVVVDPDDMPIIQVRYLMNNPNANEKGHGWYETPAIVLETGEIKIQPVSTTTEGITYRLVVIE